MEVKVLKFFVVFTLQTRASFYWFILCYTILYNAGSINQDFIQVSCPQGTFSNNLKIVGGLPWHWISSTLASRSWACCLIIVKHWWLESLFQMLIWESSCTCILRGIIYIEISCLHVVLIIYRTHFSGSSQNFDRRNKNE